MDSLVKALFAWNFPQNWAVTGWDVWHEVREVKNGIMQTEKLLLAIPTSEIIFQVFISVIALVMFLLIEEYADNYFS